MNKDTLRTQILTLRRNLDVRIKHQADKQIDTTILALPNIQNAKTISVYISLPEEVDTRRIIEALWKLRKAVVVPKIFENFPMLMPVDSWTDLRPGNFGVLEPVGSQFINAQEVEVFLVPGVAFDMKGNRLGWGKGHYDKLLEKVTAPKIGLAYQCQIVSGLPTASYDIPMDTVITEKETYAIKKS